MERDEKAFWNQKYADAPEKWLEPDPFLETAYNEFLSCGNPGAAIDIAGGAGRHALWLAKRGWQVKLVDISDVGLRLAEQKASGERHASIIRENVDLASISDLGREKYDLILVFYFLRRELFPALISALKPKGFLIYRTYTIEQQKLGRGPGDAQFLLQPNELLQAFTQLRIRHYRETIAEKATAELVAQKNT
jgi:SAM-dependent methyltransferase